MKLPTVNESHGCAGTSTDSGTVRWRSSTLRVTMAAWVCAAGFACAQTSPDSTSATREQFSSKSLFLAAFLPTVGAGLAQMMVNWFEQRFVSSQGEIVEGDGQILADDAMYEDEGEGDETASSRPSRARPGSPPGDGSQALGTHRINLPAGAAPAHAGIAYEIYARAPEGSWRRVSPSGRVFRTGDRIIVAYRPNMPGKITVVNVNPSGAEKLIETREATGGQLLQLGPYEFARQPGRDVLRIELTPCKTMKMLAAKDIVLAGELTAVPPNLAGCSEREAVAKTRSIRLKRDIIKVQAEGGTGYAVDRIGREESETGAYGSRAVELVFRHVPR